MDGLASLVVTDEEMDHPATRTLCTSSPISEEGRGLGRSPIFLSLRPFPFRRLLRLGVCRALRVLMSGPGSASVSCLSLHPLARDPHRHQAIGSRLTTASLAARGRAAAG
ncbi:hypothetical protein Skr01_57140 [Sphaerisporangium krabiense]|nr:hypothetical protein Skr01_57140 [Sphaerisporangium krabiense]